MRDVEGEDFDVAADFGHGVRIESVDKVSEIEGVVGSIDDAGGRVKGQRVVRDRRHIAKVLCAS